LPKEPVPPVIKILLFSNMLTPPPNSQTNYHIVAAPQIFTSRHKLQHKPAEIIKIKCIPLYD
jgi:hypothetical protein